MLCGAFVLASIPMLSSILFLHHLDNGTSPACFLMADSSNGVKYTATRAMGVVRAMRAK